MYCLHVDLRFERFSASSAEVSNPNSKPASLLISVSLVSLEKIGAIVSVVAIWGSGSSPT